MMTKKYIVKFCMFAIESAHTHYIVMLILFIVDSIYIVDLFLAKKGVISIEKAFGRKSSPLSLSSKVLISHEDGAP